MIRFSTVIIVVAMSSLSFGESLKAVCERLHGVASRALAKKDIAGFEKAIKPWVTKDFKHIENGQSMTFDQMIMNMKQGMGMLKTITKATAKTISCKESGNTGTTTVFHTMAGTMVGEDKKPHVMSFEGTSVNKFKKVNGKWLMSEMKWGKQTMKMDGKPFDPTQMGAQPK